jgi:DNA sulfur modification protein DndB
MQTTWHAPSIRGTIGNWVYYSTVMSAQQIASRIVTSKRMRGSKAQDDHLQGNLEQAATRIARYIKRRDDRFFNSIILGVCGGLPGWVELDFSAIGEKLGIPDTSTIEESLGLLIFDGGEEFFAIHGQHRVEGIKLAMADDPARLQGDQYPALLVAHRDDTSGKVRTRRLCRDTAENVVAVSEGDRVMTDEDELPAIVTRRIYAGFPPFRRGEEIAVTGKKEQLNYKGKDRFTSILAIHTVCKRLSSLYKKPRGLPENAAQNVRAFQEIVAGFFDFCIANERSLNRYFHSGKTTLSREREKNRNLFFRPVGLEVLARLYAHFVRSEDLETFASGLKTLPFENPNGVFDGVLWNNGKIEASSKAKKAAVELCLYFLDRLSAADEKALRLALRDVTRNASYELPPKPVPSAP